MTKLLSIFLILFLAITFGFAQIQTEGIPKSLNKKANFQISSKVTSISMPFVNVQKLIEEDK